MATAFPMRSACLIMLASTLSGCVGFAPRRLYEDQIGYTRSLGDSGKAQTLLNIVRLRYGDSPVFLNATQVISGYSLSQNLSGGVTVVPGSHTLTGSPGVSMSQNPTFTFQPVTGEAFANSYVRPLSPTELLPLSLSGTPIDVLFRLAVQSVNGFSNSSMLDPSNRSGSPGFYRLLANLRRLQTAGLLGVRLEPGETPGDDKSKVGGRLILSIADNDDPDTEKLIVETRRMLGMPEKMREAQVEYGSGRPAPGTIALLTRPILGVMGQVASEVAVPDEDVTGGRTIPTVQDAGVLGRPVVVIRSGDKAPRDAFASARYHERWYWIADDDFDSKYAFSVLQTLLALASTNPQSNTVVTIPAR